MKAIGFANKFYTLWEVQYKNVENEFEKYTLVSNVYVKNISTDVSKVKELYPNVPIYESLNGHSLSFEVITNKQQINEDKFNFGKYVGNKINECTDSDYLCWFFNNSYGARKDNVANRLIELGFIIQNNLILSKEEVEKRKIIENKVKSNEILEIKFDRNLYICDEHDKTYGEYVYNDIIFRFNDIKINSYNGFEYALPVVDGKAKRIKNKLIKVTKYNYEITDYDIIVEVLKFNIDKN